MALELGGARNDPRNLWPQPGPSPNPKDALENRLRARVCAGQLNLRTAQLAIARNWVIAQGAITQGIRRSRANMSRIGVITAVPLGHLGVDQARHPERAVMLSRSSPRDSRGQRLR